MRFIAAVLLATGALLTCPPALAQAAQAEGKADAKAAPRQLSIENKSWKGDFDQILERRMLRVLVPYSRTLYFSDKGHERGITAELVRDFERHLNRKYAKQLGKRPLTVYVIPTTRDKLLPHLTDGLGDIAAGNLTATDARRKIVDMFAPEDGNPVRELVVSGPGAPAVATLDDLAAQTVHVRPASSYHESVAALNARLSKERKRPVKVVPLPDALEDEDILEMLNAGLFQFVVVDDWKAKMWAQILPKVKVREDLVLRAEGHPGWAMRKGSPKLMAEVASFHEVALKRQGGAVARVASHFRRVKQMKNNVASEEMKRFEATVQLFERYGGKYGFDPLMLAAQGFQESQLQQNARSHVGAIGVMQIMPATGKELGVGDITQIEPNIHGGAKYMDQLMTKYFPDAKFSPADRPLFAFASYNCGPGNVARMRKEAAKQGLDPDKWFNNVEIVTAQKIGAETTTYVRNIYKYYVAYRLVRDAQQASAKVRQQVEGKN
jgi:membrane-bound lytic murein transglycosylase MltF